MKASFDSSREKLIEAATSAMGMAWCPYSKFAVGAAILMSDGEIITGCNVENSSFGLTNCAERTAVFTAISRGYGRGDFIGIVVRAGETGLAPPVGPVARFCPSFSIQRLRCWPSAIRIIK